jgi:hypothetical protein
MMWGVIPRFSFSVFPGAQAIFLETRGSWSRAGAEFGFIKMVWWSYIVMLPDEMPFDNAATPPGHGGPWWLVKLPPRSPPPAEQAQAHQARAQQDQAPGQGERLNLDYHVVEISDPTFPTLP